MARRKLNWIETTGGPHIVVPEKHAIHWEGISEPSHGRVVKASSPSDSDGPATDYDRACDVKDWMGLLRVGRGSGVVLSGDITRAAYYSWQGRHFILRWVAADSEKHLLSAFQKTIDDLPVDEELEFRHSGGQMFLFDSTDIPRSWFGEFSAFDLPAGRYRVTAQYRDCNIDDAGYIVHEWQRSGR